MNKNKVYTHVSLFSGAGGLDIGLEQAGFRTVWANDFNHDACETHRLWSNATVVEGDIGKVDYDTMRQAGRKEAAKVVPRRERQRLADAWWRENQGRYHRGFREQGICSVYQPCQCCGLSCPGR